MVNNSPDLRLLLRSQRFHLQRPHQIQPLQHLQRLEQRPSGVSQLLSGAKVSLFGYPSIVSERESTLKQVLAGWVLHIYKLPLPQGVSVEPAGKKPH